jgi:hypothetical protein
MKEKAMILLAGGALLALGMYLFPWYYGAELFTGWTTSMAGGNELLGVLWAGVLAGVLLLAGLLIVRPGIFSLAGNPLYLAGAVVVVILAASFALNAWGG